jgi:hypothetical protein
MTERLRVVDEDPVETPPETTTDSPTLLERAERAAMLAIARLGDSPRLVPLASLGLEAEIRARRLVERYLTFVWHAYQLPTRRELLTVAEQVSSLRHRLAALEQRLDDRDDRGGRGEG